MIDLGTLGGSESKASGVSADGSVVAGYSWCNTTIYHAFSWTQGSGMVDLGTVGGGSYSNANGVSADGSAVVGYSDTSFGHWHAFRWK
jgi:probable HAF family extracellular repeat protein